MLTLHIPRIKLKLMDPQKKWKKLKFSWMTLLRIYLLHLHTSSSLWILNSLST